MISGIPLLRFCTLLSDINDRFDQIPWLLIHYPEGVFDLVKALVFIIDKLARMYAVGLDHLQTLADAVCAAGAHAAADVYIIITDNIGRAVFSGEFYTVGACTDPVLFS